MYRVSFITLIFALLSLLTISCAPGPNPTSCPNGTVLDTTTGSCVDNSCVNYPCDDNQHCIVSSQDGPYCVCDAGYESDIDTSGATTPLLVCNKIENSCSCTGYNTHCDSIGDCECDAGYLPVHDYSGIHPVLDCVVNPCYNYRCPQEAQMCQAEFNDNNNEWVPICDYE